MIQFRLHKNVIVELPRIEKRRSLKNTITIDTLEKAESICRRLILPKIKVEVVKDAGKHPLSPPYTGLGFYVSSWLIPNDYSIEPDTSLIVVKEDDKEFLVTFLHECGHAVEPKDSLGEDCAEMWAWLFAFFIFYNDSYFKEAKECWSEFLKYKRKLQKTN